MVKKQPGNEHQPANLAYDKMKNAISKLDRRIADLKAFNIQTIQTGVDASLIALSQKIDQLITDIFGNNSHEYHKYHPYSDLRTISLSREQDCQIKNWTQDKINKAIAILETIKEGFLETLEDAEVSGTQAKAIKAYDGLELHPEIARAASSLFHDGHYANAIEDAVKALNNLVRLRTGLDADGVSLMQKAFSQSNPILRFNALADNYDRNEQKGFMEWFTGTVSGLRNPRAHKIIKDDPEMALEFIAFISLQAKLVNKATLTTQATVAESAKEIDKPTI